MKLGPYNIMMDYPAMRGLLSELDFTFKSPYFENEAYEFSFCLNVRGILSASNPIEIHLVPHNGLPRHEALTYGNETEALKEALRSYMPVDQMLRIKRLKALIE